jgi:aryl-alcohol dehydrogenase-like predicted oxidoreductase
VSNFTATQLQELFDYAEPRNLVLPSVFEGNYSAITRHLERDIFPLIRKHGMSFYAYSPLAGGFLAKKQDAILRAEGRWNPETRVGAMYQKMYNRPQLLEALGDWAGIADEAGLTKAALAYRWIAYHSHLDAGRGDAIIVGASRPDQLHDTLTILRAGPLDPQIVQNIGAVWEKVKDFAPVDNIQM